MKARPIQDVPRVGLTYEEAAASVGVSLTHFKKHVLPRIKVVHSGGSRIVPLRELERFVEREAERSLAGDVA